MAVWFALMVPAVVGWTVTVTTVCAPLPKFPRLVKSLTQRITLLEGILSINRKKGVSRDIRRSLEYGIFGPKEPLKLVKSEEKGYFGKKHAQIAINSGFFKNLHCFFLEFPQNDFICLLCSKKFILKFSGGN